MSLVYRKPKQLRFVHIPKPSFKGDARPTPTCHCSGYVLQRPSVFSLQCQQGCDAAGLHTLQEEEQKLQAKVLALAAMRKKLIKELLEAENTYNPDGSTVQVCFLAQLLQHCQPL